MKKIVLGFVLSLMVVNVFAFVNPRNKGWDEYERECWLNEEDANYDYWFTVNEVVQDGQCDLEKMDKWAKENGFKDVGEYTDYLFERDTRS